MEVTPLPSTTAQILQRRGLSLVLMMPLSETEASGVGEGASAGICSEQTESTLTVVDHTTAQLLRFCT